MNDVSFIEKLLDGVEIEWKVLGEVAEIGTGSSNRQDEKENGKYPFYVRSKNILKSNVFQFNETSIVVPREGGVGDIFHYVQGKYALHQRAYRIHIISDKLNSRGVAIFAKACFGHPSPSKQQKLNATTYASGGPDSSSSPRPDPTRGRNIGSK